MSEQIPEAPAATPEAPATPPAEPTTPETPDTIQVSKADWDRQQSALAALRRKADDADKAAKKAAEDKAKQDGEHLKLAEAAQKERDDALAKVAAMEAAGRVTRAATARKFRDPDDAMGLLPDTLDLADHTAVEAALDALATAKPYLIDAAPAPPTGRTGGPSGGADTPNSLDEQIAAAEQAGDFKALARLNVQKLAAVKTTT